MTYPLERHDCGCVTYYDALSDGYEYDEVCEEHWAAKYNVDYDPDLSREANEERVATIHSGNDETEDERDARLHFERQQQVYLTYYQNERGGLFSLDTYPSSDHAARNAQLFADDGLPARVLKVTVENGEPVARWFT